jgi:hypothetical protein
LHNTWALESTAQSEIREVASLTEFIALVIESANDPNAALKLEQSLE